MIFIQTNAENKVEFIHYSPFDSEHGLQKDPMELQKEGYLVNEIPEPESHEGKVAEAYYTAEKGLWYEYVAVPESNKYGVDISIYNQIIDDYTLNLVEGGILR